MTEIHPIHLNGSMSPFKINTQKRNRDKQQKAPNNEKTPHSNKH